MNNKLNKKLHKLLGIEECWHEPPKNGGGYQDVCVKCHWVHYDLREQNPDYCNDLNAIRKAKKALPVEKRVEYCNILYEITGAIEDPWDYTMASAKQCVRALISILEQDSDE